MRYAFFSKSKHSNLKSPVKNPGRQGCSEEFNSGIKGLMNTCISLQISICPLITCTIPSYFPSLATNFTSQEKWSNPILLYQIWHASQTAKIFKCICERIFRRTHLMAMHNTVMTRNTNGVPPSQIHITKFLQAVQIDWLSSSSNTELKVPQKAWQHTW